MPSSLSAKSLVHRAGTRRIRSTRGTWSVVISSNVLYNYLEANNRVPWQDLQYLFGEIMYGGHITDDWDRRLCKVKSASF